jgi:hypothetical protein
MRFTERFLILLALFAFILRMTGSPQGAAMQLVSVPPLALFYLLFMPSLLNAPWREHYARPAPLKRVLFSISAGIILAYCLMSMLFAALGSFPVLYAVESAVLSLVLFAISALFLRGAELRDFRRGLLIRGLGLSTAIVLAGLFALDRLPRIH